MAGLLVLILLSITSAGAYVIGLRCFGLKTSQLQTAGRRALEWVGLTLVFFALNLGTGISVILALRRWNAEFVSMYFVNDATIGLASMFQAVAFQWWRIPCAANPE
jgi:hypothetical protein